MFKCFKSISKYRKFKRLYSDCQPCGSKNAHTSLTILDNGLRVATETISSPLTCIAMFIEAGPRFETAYNNGITHMVEHMAYKG